MIETPPTSTEQTESYVPPTTQEEYRVNKQGILERYYEGQWVEDTSR